jgi:hypothetical protein
VREQVVKYMNTLQDWEIDSTLPKDDVRGKYQPLAISLDDELDARADDGMASLRDKQNDILKSLGDQYVNNSLPLFRVSRVSCVCGRACGRVSCVRLP